MAKKLFTTSYLSDIANSIRTKLGVETRYKISDMASAIDSIVSKEQPRLYEPTAIVSGDILTITPSENNGWFNVGSTYTIYIDGDIYELGTDTTCDLWEISGGRYVAGVRQVKVIQHQTYFRDSPEVGAGNWESTKNGLRITAINNSITINLRVFANSLDDHLSIAPDIYYKKSTENRWYRWFNAVDGTSSYITLNANEYITIYNKVQSLGNNERAYLRFEMSGSGQAVATGNAMSLLYGASSLPNYAFFFLFQGCANLTTLHNDSLERDNYFELPSTNLTSHCYYGMFESTGLVELPHELPATIMAEYCYGAMFRFCSSLNDLVNNRILLNITTLANNCMEFMFYECTAQSVGIDVPQAEVMEEDCYRFMFQRCNFNLISLALIEPKVLARNCFNSMYRYCSRINLSHHYIFAGGDIPYGAYSGMFFGCVSITELPTFETITSLNPHSLKDMFCACNNLKVGHEAQEGATIGLTLPSELPSQSVNNMFLNCQTYHDTGWSGGTPLAGQTIYWKS